MNNLAHLISGFVKNRFANQFEMHVPEVARQAGASVLGAIELP